jgi:hypothetical protein
LEALFLDILPTCPKAYSSSNRFTSTATAPAPIGTCAKASRAGERSGASISTFRQAGQWFWCLNDRAPSPAADRGYAPTRAKAMLMLKHRWRERGPLKYAGLHAGVDEESARVQARNRLARRAAALGRHIRYPVELPVFGDATLLLAARITEDKLVAVPWPLAVQTSLRSRTPHANYISHAQ